MGIWQKQSQNNFVWKYIKYFEIFEKSYEFDKIFAIMAINSLTFLLAFFKFQNLCETHTYAQPKV